MADADDEPRAMSQEEIDALFASLSGSMPAVPKADPDAPPEEAGGLSQDEIDQVVSQSGRSAPVEEPAGALDQDAIDALLADMGGDEPAAASQPEPAAPAEPAGALDQDAIDALLADMGGDEPAVAAEPEPAAPAEPAGALDQDAIDALLADMDAGDPEPAAPEPAAPAEPAGALDQDAIDALLADMGGGDPEPAAPEPAAAAEPAGALDQDAIDALLADMGGGDPEPAAPEPAAAAEPAGALDQDAIDALLADLGGDDAAESPVEAVPEPVAATPPPGDAGALDQDAIDALLAEMGGEEDEPAPAAAEPVAAAADDAGGLDQDAIDALLAEMGGGDDLSGREPTIADVPSPAHEVGQESDAVAKAAGDAALDQDAIDSLLAELSGSTEPAAAAPSTGETGKVRTNLSAEELDELVAKHDEGGEDTEALISQDDIDSLVRQMSEATGAPDSENLDEIMAARESDIEALLDQAASGLQAEDAVAEVSAFEQRAPTMAGATAVPVGGMAPEELRGTRFLLVAAVFLLAMCTVTMVLVVTAINRLSSELERGRTAQVESTDDYSQDLKVALELLEHEDDFEVAKGEKFMQRLRRTYPDQEIEITLLLARHLAGRGAHDVAVREFATVSDREGRVVDDPTFYLDYAESFAALGRRDDARRTVLILLANEQRYLAPPDPEDPLGEEISIRNQSAVRRAYLLLGRIDLAEIDAGDLAMNAGSGGER